MFRWGEQKQFSIQLQLYHSFNNIYPIEINYENLLLLLCIDICAETHTFIHAIKKNLRNTNQYPLSSL